MGRLKKFSVALVLVIAVYGHNPLKANVCCAKFEDTRLETF